MNSAPGKPGRKPIPNMAPLHTRVTQEAKDRLEANCLLMGISMGSVLTSLILSHLPHVPEKDIKRSVAGPGLESCLRGVLYEFPEGEVDPELAWVLIAEAAAPLEGHYEDPGARLSLHLADPIQGRQILRRAEKALKRDTVPPTGADLVTWARSRQAALHALRAALAPQSTNP